MSIAELRALLSHPDAFVRAMADHALHHHQDTAPLQARLAALQARLIAASDQYFLDV
jgi:hypothetical protein